MGAPFGKRISPSLHTIPSLLGSQVWGPALAWPTWNSNAGCTKKNGSGGQNRNRLAGHSYEIRFGRGFGKRLGGCWPGLGGDFWVTSFYTPPEMGAPILEPVPNSVWKAFGGLGPCQGAGFWADLMPLCCTGTREVVHSTAC